MSLPCFLHGFDYRQYVKPYAGMRETGYNRGPFIDSANRKYAYLGAPYCASSVSLILDRSRASVPRTRSAAAKAFINTTSVSSSRIWSGRELPPANSLVVFTRKGGGHIEFLIRTLGDTILCFGFNTTPDGKSGSQWNGTWSGYKKRSIKKSCSPYNIFRVTHFTPVEYETVIDRRAVDSGNPGWVPYPNPSVRGTSTSKRQSNRYSGSRASDHSTARYSIFD